MVFTSVGAKEGVGVGAKLGVSDGGGFGSNTVALSPGIPERASRQNISCIVMFPENLCFHDDKSEDFILFILYGERFQSRLLRLRFAASESIGNDWFHFDKIVLL